jgi:hypothetical protein
VKSVFTFVAVSSMVRIRRPKMVLFTEGWPSKKNLILYFLQTAQKVVISDILGDMAKVETLRKLQCKFTFTCQWGLDMHNAYLNNEQKRWSFTVLRICDVYRGSNFFHPGSRVDKIPDPEPDPQKRIYVFLEFRYF